MYFLVWLIKIMFETIVDTDQKKNFLKKSPKFLHILKQSCTLNPILPSNFPETTQFCLQIFLKPHNFPVIIRWNSKGCKYGCITFNYTFTLLLLNVINIGKKVRLAGMTQQNCMAYWTGYLVSQMAKMFYRSDQMTFN